MRWAKRIHKFFRKLRPKVRKSCCINRKFLYFTVAIAHYKTSLHLFENAALFLKF